MYAVYIHVDCFDVSVLSVDNFGPLKSVNCRPGRNDLGFHFWLVVEFTLVIRTKL